jgi:proteic killer suppression protein
MGRRRSHRLFITLYVTRIQQYNRSVILGYGDKRTRDFALGRRVKRFSGIQRSARVKLDRLDAAVALKDMSALPGNRFVALRGDRKGQYSIRINQKWRICFEWDGTAAGPTEVEIVDYH